MFGYYFNFISRFYFKYCFSFGFFQFSFHLLILHFVAKPSGPQSVHTAPGLKQHQQNKSKWKKRWILLQDNFLMCYKVDSSTTDPVLVIRLQNHKIVPISEREIGKKYAFLLTCGKHVYYFAAANPQVLMKWINLLSDVTSWYQSEDDILFKEFEFDGSNVFRKSESLDALSSVSRKKILGGIFSRSETEYVGLFLYFCFCYLH